MIALVLALAVFAFVLIRPALANDNLDALEALDDETLAAEAANKWNRGEWS